MGGIGARRSPPRCGHPIRASSTPITDYVADHPDDFGGIYLTPPPVALTSRSMRSASGWWIRTSAPNR